MRGCETIPMAARKKPHCRQRVQLPQTILREHGQEQLLFKALENLFHARPNKPREHNRVLAESQVPKCGREQKDETAKETDMETEADSE